MENSIKAVVMTTERIVAGDNKPHLAACETAFAAEIKPVAYENGTGSAPDAHVLTPANGATIMAVNKNKLEGADTTPLFEAGEGCHETIAIGVNTGCKVTAYTQAEYGPEGFTKQYD